MDTCARTGTSGLSSTQWWPLDCHQEPAETSSRSPNAESQLLCHTGYDLSCTEGAGRKKAALVKERTSRNGWLDALTAQQDR